MSTKTQCSCLPMALWSSAATTEESTPPESPQITCDEPTRSRTCAAAVSAKELIRHSPRTLQIS